MLKQSGEGLNGWRESHSKRERFCGFVLLFGFGLFCAACVLGGAMGDHGPMSAVEMAKYDRESAAWFRNSFGGLGFSIVAAIWWSKGERRRRGQ